MTLEPPKPLERSDSTFEDSGFLNPNASSDPAEADYTELNEANNDLENLDEAAAQNSGNNDTNKDAERQRRIMSRIPQ